MVKHGLILQFHCTSNSNDDKDKKKTSELTDSATKEFSRYSSLPTVSEKRNSKKNENESNENENIENNEINEYIGSTEKIVSDYLDD